MSSFNAFKLKVTSSGLLFCNSDKCSKNLKRFKLDFIASFEGFLSIFKAPL